MSDTRCSAHRFLPLKFSSLLLDRYIAREFLLSFLVSFLFYFFVFFLNQLLLMAQQILSKGIPLGKVMRLMLYSLPSFITLSAPFATLTAALMAYGRFSSDNEVLAMRTAGFPRFTIFRPVLVLGIILALLSFGINNILLPAGTRAFQRLWIELSLTYPGLELEPFSVRSFKNSIIVTGAIDQEGIHPMMIIERDNSGNRNSIVAAVASPDIRANSGTFPGFRMQHVLSLIPSSANMDSWTWSQADSMEYRLLTESSVIIDQQSSPSNMKVGEIHRVILKKKESFEKVKQAHFAKVQKEYRTLSDNYALFQTGASNYGEQNSKDLIKNSYLRYMNLNKQKPSDSSLQRWRLEYYQKYAIPFACIPFVVIAFSLGLTARRSGRSLGFFLGLLLTTLYWALLVLGRSLGLKSNISPFAAMIVPDLLLLAVGIGLYLRRSLA
ncbi:MAG: hypothetical protein CSA76_03395 [Spirochaetales bacterium]|nr:MAG: hypothetical protein CSA76_03395 [Spirochaetales bacterium]